MTEDRVAVLSWLTSVAIVAIVVFGLLFEWKPVVYVFGAFLLVGLAVSVFFVGAFIVAAVWALFTGHFPKWFQ